MLCPQCGHSCRSGVLFCEICGAQLPSDAGRPLAPAGVRSRLLRSGFASPVALVMIIAYSVAAALNLFIALNIPMYIRESLRDLAGFMGAGDGRFEPFATIYSIVLLVTFLPGLIIAVGSWITFLSAASGTGRMTNILGLQLVNFGLVAELTFRCINFGWMGYVFLSSGGDPRGNLSYSYLYGYSFSGAVLLRWSTLVSGILMLLLLNAYIVYYRKAIRQVWCMRASVESGVPAGRISTYLVVFTFAMGALVISDAFLLPDPFIAVSSAFTAVARIASGVLLLIFRKNMQTICLKKQEDPAPAKGKKRLRKR